MCTPVEQVLRRLTAAGAHQALPHVVLSVCTKQHLKAYEFSTSLPVHGALQLHGPSHDSIFGVASCTKLLTAIATLQCVAKGLVSLHTPVVEILPEFGQRPVLAGFDNYNEAVLTPCNIPVLVLHLLTHTSGLAYEQVQPIVRRWFESQGLDPDELRGKPQKLHGVPLLARPGDEWNYGQGLDWAGKLVCHLTGFRQLGEYFDEHIFKPLGIRMAGYRRESFPVADDDLARLSVCRACRSLDGSLTASSSPTLLDAQEYDCGGGGLFISPNEFVKILHSLLRNDGVLLKVENALEWCFKPQFENKSTQHCSLLAQLGHAPWAALMRAGAAAPSLASPDEGDMEYNFSLIGLLSRRRGSSHWRAGWSGLPNVFWNINPEQGIASLWCTDLMPPGDTICTQIYQCWLREIETHYSSQY